jgi:hypothetical protein
MLTYVLRRVVERESTGMLECAVMHSNNQCSYISIRRKPVSLRQACVAGEQSIKLFDDLSIMAGSKP